LREGKKLIREGMSPIDIKNGILKGKEKILEYLQEIKRPVESKEDLFNVAMVSTNYDEFLSKLLSEAVFESGKNGTVHIEPSRSLDTFLLVMRNSYE
jgi:chaperonin GroEL